MSRSQTAEQRFDARYKIDPVTGCWNWTAGLSNQEYGCLRVNARMTLSHRYSYERFNGVIPSGASVCHRCDNPKCVNPEHLFVGSHSDNMRDMVQKGRNAQPNGERNGNSRLTDTDATRIRNEVGRCRTVDLARQFGVSPSTVYRIQKGELRKFLATTAPEGAF